MSISLFKRNLLKCGQDITLQNRNIESPDFGTPDFDEDFTDTDTIPALINTERGNTLFDGVSTDRTVTHKLCIEYLAGVTAQTWIKFKDRRFDIVDVENYRERDELLILRCNERGVGEAAKI